MVQTLRDPVESVPSLCSLINVLHSAYSDHTENILSADEVMNSLKHDTERYIASREKADPAGFYDIHYKSLVKDPMTAVRKLYEHFGYEFNHDFEKRMQEWLAENRQHKHGKHRYSLEQFGLDRDMVYSALDKYCRRFGLLKK